MGKPPLRPKGFILLALLLGVCIAPVFVSSGKIGMMPSAQTALSARDAISATIEQIPGINIRTLMDAVNRTNGVVQYHLGQMQLQQEVFTVNLGHLKGYFPVSYRKLSRKQLVALVAARHPVRCAILNALLNGPRTVSALAAATGMNVNKILFHVQKLEEAGILDSIEACPLQIQIAGEVCQALQQFVFC